MDLEGIKLLKDIDSRTKANQEEFEKSYARSRFENIQVAELVENDWGERLKKMEGELSSIKDAGFFSRLFNGKEQRKVTQSREELRKEINSLRNELSDIRQIINDFSQFNERDTKLNSEKLKAIEEYNIPLQTVVQLDCFTFDENGRATFDADKFKDIESNNEFDISKISDENKVLVHKTNYFPSSGKVLTNFDGHKTKPAIFKFSDFVFKYQMSSCRHTSHFTLNRGVSSSHGYGNWDNSGFVILEDFAPHKDKFVNISAADSWARESIPLIKPLIMVREREYDNLTEEQKKNPNIVIVKAKDNETYQESIKEIIGACGKPVSDSLGDDTTNYHSDDARYEIRWEVGQTVLYLMGSNHNAFDNNLTLSKEEMGRWAFLMKMFSNLPLQTSNVEVKTENGSVVVEPNVSEQIFYSGFRKNPDGSFTRQSDYKALIKELGKLMPKNSDNNENLSFEEYSKIKQDVIRDFITQNGVVEIQEMVNEYQKQYDNTPMPSFAELSKMQYSSIPTFENLKFLSAASKVLKNLSNKTVYQKDGKDYSCYFVCYANGIDCTFDEYRSSEPIKERELLATGGKTFGELYQSAVEFAKQSTAGEVQIQLDDEPQNENEQIKDEPIDKNENLEEKTKKQPNNNPSQKELEEDKLMEEFLNLAKENQSLKNDEMEK